MKLYICTWYDSGIKKMIVCILVYLVSFASTYCSIVEKFSTLNLPPCKHLLSLAQVDTPAQNCQNCTIVCHVLSKLQVEIQLGLASECEKATLSVYAEFFSGSNGFLYWWPSLLYFCRMFTSTCKKLRIMKRSEATGLGSARQWRWIDLRARQLVMSFLFLSIIFVLLVGSPSQRMCAALVL